MRTSTRHPLPRLAVLTAALLALAACGRDEPAPATAPAAGVEAPTTALGRTVEKAMNEARAELEKENIGLGDVSRIRINGLTFGDHVETGNGKDANGNPLPKAEVTPTGGLLIDGKPVALEPAQQALMLAYRKELLGVIETGMALGARGADLGMVAATEAIKGIFSGNGAEEALNKRMEAEGQKMKAEAAKMCGRLPALLSAQQAAAAAIPQFVPYARMVSADIDECLVETEQAVAEATAPDAVRNDVRKAVRDGVRDAVRVESETSPADEAAAAR